MTDNLVSNCAVVTGASPGINPSIALALAQRGASVACLDVQERYANACADWLVRQGHRAIAITCDVTDEVAVARSINRVQEELGIPGIVVNGAAMHRPEGLLVGSAANFRLHVETILVGAYLVSREVARSLVHHQERGAIVNLLSTEAHQGNPISAGYGAAKSGLWGFTRSAAMELAPYGVRVNSLTPTGTDPAQAREQADEWGIEWLPPARAQVPPDFSRGGDGIPLGSRPNPSDYGGAVAFLCSEDARMVTGVDLRVDGGAVTRYWRWNPVGQQG